MSRPLEEMERTVTSTKPAERRLARSTARAFAAAISALLVSTLVVSRSDAALTSEGSVSAATAVSGTISVTDDDDGRSLFDLQDLAPGRPFERCVEIQYDGSILPVDLTLIVGAQGDLPPFLMTTIESGSGGSFATCEGFMPAKTIFDGTLAELAGEDATEVSRMYNTGDRRTLRVRFEIEDSNEALGRSATASFVWEVRP
jgi:hypothetical protein